MVSQPPEAPLPPKPPRKRHPSFDLQALLAPRRTTAAPRSAESPAGGASRSSPLSWLGRRALADPVITTSMAAAIPGWGGGGGGGVLIRGVEVSSKEVVDHTGSPRQHVLLGRTERETGADKAGSTAQRYLLLRSSLNLRAASSLPDVDDPPLPSILQQAVPALVQDAELREAVCDRPEGGRRHVPASAGALRHPGLHPGEGGVAVPQLGHPQRLSRPEPAPRHGGGSGAESVAAGLLQ